MLITRYAYLADIPLIRTLTFKVWPQTYAPILSEEQIAYMLDMMYRPIALEKQMQNGHQFIICYDEELPVGFASYEAMDQEVYKLHKIYVLADQQGKGIGNHMLQFIKNDITKKGGEALDLNVNRYNQTAISFYNKQGFNFLKEEDIHIGKNFFMNDYVLRLALV
ncbi:MAG: GNAT family N-acetyltransferase [Bacteroidota bacterium]